MSANFISGKTLRRKHRNYSHTSGDFTDKIPGQCIVTQPMHSGLNRNIVHAKWKHCPCTEPLLDQAYMHLLKCHILLSTKINHNKHRNRLSAQLLAEYMRGI